MLLNEEYRLIQSAVKKLADQKIRPFAKQWDEEKTFPTPAIQALRDAGLMGMLIPEKWGGAEMDYLAYVLAIIEIAKADASVSTIISVHNSVASLPILYKGTDHQKQTYLVPLARGEKLGCFCLSEPEAGSDANALQTRAEKKGDHYILNGIKQFVTSGNHAQLAIVFAKLPEGTSAFIVPTNSTGFHITKIEHKMGQHAAHTTQIMLENVTLLDSALLGTPGEGFKIALHNLESGRLGIAAQAIGMAEEALNLSLQYAKERKTFGKYLYEHEAISFNLADSATKLEAAKQLLFHAAALRNQQQPCLKECSMAKLFSTEIAESICHDAIQIFGGYGYLTDFPLEKIYRDVRVTTLYEGTSEIQRLIIGRELFRS